MRLATRRQLRPRGRSAHANRPVTPARSDASRGRQLRCHRDRDASHCRRHGRLRDLAGIRRDRNSRHRPCHGHARRRARNSRRGCRGGGSGVHIHGRRRSVHANRHGRRHRLAWPWAAARASAAAWPRITAATLPRASRRRTGSRRRRHSHARSRPLWHLSRAHADRARAAAACHAMRLVGSHAHTSATRGALALCRNHDPALSVTPASVPKRLGATAGWRCVCRRRVVASATRRRARAVTATKIRHLRASAVERVPSQQLPARRPRVRRPRASS